MDSFKIYASEIAALAGMNPYESQKDAVEKFRDREDHANFIKETQERGEEPEWLSAKKLKEDPRFQDKVQEAVKLSSNTTELKTKKDIIEKKIDKSAGTEKEKTLIKQEIQRSANTAFGTHHETSVLQKWCEETGKTVTKNLKRHRKEVFQIGRHRFDLIGRVDGIVEGDDTSVLEIKNRTKRLFNEVRRYEMVQVQAYCFLLNCEKAYLVEALKTKEGFKMDWNEISRDRDLWEEVLQEAEKALREHFIDD